MIGKRGARTGLPAWAAAGVAVALVVSTAGSAAADTPPPNPVIGPLQLGPPAYPPTVGITLSPPGRAGISASVNALSPVTGLPTAQDTGPVTGIRTGADGLSPGYPATAAAPAVDGLPAPSQTGPPCANVGCEVDPRA